MDLEFWNEFLNGAPISNKDNDVEDRSCDGSVEMEFAVNDLGYIHALAEDEEIDLDSARFSQRSGNFGINSGRGLPK